MQQIPEIVQIVHQAIDREKEAIATYLRLAKITRDVKAKDVLINLASDEVGHMTALEGHLSSLLQGQAPFLAAAGKDAAAVLTPSAKLEEFEGREMARADEIRILELAIDKEIAANKAYLDLAAKAKTPEGREMFLALAGEEETHARILRAEVDSIGQNGFWFDMQEFTMEK